MAAKIITSLPPYISPEEHRNLTASTPSSFASIPPVVRHIEQNVSVSLDPPLENFSAEDCKEGTLYVIESVLVFMSSSGRGFQIEYPSITLHAISRADSGPAIYCQLDESLPESDASPLPTADPDEGDNPMRELNITPQNQNALELIFEALSLCASLHPDPQGDMDDDDDDYDALLNGNEAAEFEVFTGDTDQELSEVGRAALEHLESIIYNPFEQPQTDEKEVNGLGE